MRHGEAACDTESGDTAHIGRDPALGRVLCLCASLKLTDSFIIAWAIGDIR